MGEDSPHHVEKQGIGTIIAMGGTALVTLVDWESFARAVRAEISETEQELVALEGACPILITGQAEVSKQIYGS